MNAIFWIVWIVGFYEVMRSWGQWRTRNLPFSRGGRYENPFNDPKRFCCVFKHWPCNKHAACTPNYSDPGNELDWQARPLLSWGILTIGVGILGLWRVMARFRPGIKTETAEIVFIVSVCLWLLLRVYYPHERPDLFR